MKDWIYHTIENTGVGDPWSAYVSNALVLIAVLAIGVIAFYIIRGLTNHLLSGIASRSKSKLVGIFSKHRAFDQLVLIIPAIIVYASSPMLTYGKVMVARLALCLIVFSVVRTFDKCLCAADDLYRKTEAAKTRPLKGLFQVIRIIVYILGAIVMVSILMDQSPALLLGGIGAASAVLLLVFQNTILGFVASIQLTENDMVRIDDWIEMTSHNADGIVKEITLYTVKVENWNGTVTTIPTQSMVSESFRNWRNIEVIGGRRIKRSISIDLTSIRFCTEEMLDRYREIPYIRQYLQERTGEAGSLGKRCLAERSKPIDDERLTNLGVFRAYLEAYLRHHPCINTELTLLVRQLDPDESGLPVQLYAFTTTTNWEEFEGIQSDILDHVLAIAPEFDLRVYQKPAGHDLVRGLAANDLATDTGR